MGDRWLVVGTDEESLGSTAGIEEVPEGILRAGVDLWPGVSGGVLMPCGDLGPEVVPVGALTMHCGDLGPEVVPGGALPMLCGGLRPEVVPRGVLMLLCGSLRPEAPPGGTLIRPYGDLRMGVPGGVLTLRVDLRPGEMGLAIREGEWESFTPGRPERQLMQALNLGDLP